MEHRVSAWYRKEHTETPEILTSSDDVDRLIDDLMAAPSDHNLAQLHSLNRPRLPAGSPDHELMVGVDGGRQVGLLAFMDPEVGNVFTLGELDDQEEVAYYTAGHRMEYPERTEIAVDLIREAVKEFLVSGGKMPTCVRWQTSDLW